MSDSPIVTLVETAVRKVAVSLYNDREIRQWSKFAPREVATAEWHDLITSKISELSLPTTLQERMFEVASPVCLFMVHLHAVHSKISFMLRKPCQCLNGALGSTFFRTSDGLFDFRKTVERLVEDQRIDVAFRFTVACEFRLDECIEPLFKQLTFDVKSHFYHEKRLRNQSIAAIMQHHNDIDFRVFRIFNFYPEADFTNLLVRLAEN
ncbi:hypothetical protein AVEN_135008-1 [Araneus ventricosus]|uniref:Uncharacterized protein n=1 Tax=Araneus ventricosus TaxID=182803 RepID=A0A4Y2G5G9_ARAVE|nr:hypothetical protein AVEN_135008-1 [Araneus ventricosus]